MKNILFISNSLEIGGGIEKVFSILERNISKRNNTFYLTLYDSNKKKENINGKYFSLKENKNKNFIYKFLNRMFKIYNFCRKNKIDIIISSQEHNNFLMILMKLFRKIKIISTIHTDLSLYKNNFYFNFFIKYLYPFSNIIITISKNQENLLKKKGLKNIKTIYNPFEINRNLKLSKKKIQKEDEKYFKKKNKSDKIFLNIGRLEKQKGQWFLIRSFKKVVEEYPNSKLIILGEGSLRKDLLVLVKKLKLGKNIFLIGVRENIFRYIKKSDYFVFPSLWEGLPTAIIENLNLSKPIIATDCFSGTREILELNLDLDKEIQYPFFAEYGILIENFKHIFCFESLKEKKLNKQEKEFSKIMINTIKNKNLKERYSNGLKRAKDFDIKNIIKKWEEVIDVL